MNDDIEMGKMSPDKESNKEVDALNISRDDSSDEANTTRKLIDNDLRVDRILSKGTIN